MDESLDLAFQRVIVIFFAAMLGLATTSLAWWMGYFRPISFKDDAVKVLSWRRAIWAFIILLFVEFLIIPATYLLWKSWLQGSWAQPKIEHLNSVTEGWMNIYAVVITALALMSYYLSCSQKVQKLIWGDSFKIKHLLIGAITWLIAYPWVLMVGQIIDLILQFHYHGEHIDQVAVRHVKEALAYPLLLGSTVIAVVTIVPILEELLFRGFLQTYLKERYGIKWAIVCTSAIFALFHYASSQSIENIELLISLFIFSCFLGYVKERQNSLWASIGLHGTFNMISLMMIIW